jgi:phosphohistidine phosphatase
MPTLVIVRHAKAEVPTAGLSDHDRALTVEGRDAAGRLGERLLAAGIVPDIALVSTANRAQQTWKRMAAVLTDTQAHTVADLYEAGLGAYQRELAVLGDARVAATVAHEPTASAFASWLAGPGSDRSALQKLALGLPTSGAAVLELESWDGLERGSGRLVALLSGKLPSGKP